MLRRPSPKPPRRHVDGEPHLYLGREYRLEVERGKVDAVRLVAGAFRVTSRREATEAVVERLLDRWYREQGERLFRSRIARWHRVVAPEGTPVPSFRMRKMTSRWGSWSVASSRVNLSLLLLRAPLACVDYVVLHELCHARYRSHGPRFWALVGKYMPDYAERRRTLNGYAA
jgi:predicted metal-dependent hydrolase